MRRPKRCGKFPYPSARAAWRSIARAKREESPPLSAYRCPFCHQWHMKTKTDRKTIHRHPRHDRPRAWHRNREDEEDT